MKHTGYEVNVPGPSANGYVREADTYRDPDPSAMSVRFSAGGLFSNASDLMLLARGLTAGTILKPATVTEMWTDRGNGYAYGWIPDDDKGRKSIGHNGRIDGYASSFRLFQDEDLFIAVLSNVNGTNTERMIAALSAIAHGEPSRCRECARSLPFQPPRSSSTTDRYKLPWGLVLVVTHEGDQLFGRAGTREEADRVEGRIGHKVLRPSRGH